MIEARAVPYQRKMTLGKVLSFAFASFFKNITAVGQWMLLSLLLIIINVVPLALIVFSIMGSSTYLPAIESMGNPYENANLALMIPGAVLMLLVLIIDIGFFIFTSAWFNRLGLDAFEGKKRIFGERFKLGMKDTYRLVGPLLLLYILGWISMAPSYIVSAIDVGNGMNGDVMPFTSPMAALFYFIALVLMYFVIVRTIAIYGILLENPEMQVMDCFKESFAMTKGRGWRILGYMISLMIITSLAGGALFVPFIMIWFVPALTNFNIGITVVAILLSIIFYMVVIAFGTGTMGMLTAGIYKFLMIEHTEEVAEPLSVSNSYETIENTEEDNRE